jgi:hypothetical protein
MKSRLTDFDDLLRALKHAALGRTINRSNSLRDPELVAAIFLENYLLNPALRARLVQEALERMAAEFQREQQAAAA